MSSSLTARRMRVNGLLENHRHDTMPAGYTLVVAGSKDRALAIVKPLAERAIAAKRLRVVQGDLLHKHQFFPSEEARVWLRKAYNRSGSSSDPADRVRSLAIIFFQFYPTSSTTASVFARARDTAREAGFAVGATDIHQVETADDLRALLDDVGMVSRVERDGDPADLLSALKVFGLEYEDDAVVSSRAKNSADGWDFADPARVLRDLRAVHRVYGRWVDARGDAITARDRKRVLSDETGIVLHNEGATVTEKYRQSEFPEMGGRKLYYPLHIAYSHRDTRIHFWFPEPRARHNEPIKTLIAHAGKHLYTGERSHSDSG